GEHLMRATPGAAGATSCRPGPARTRICQMRRNGMGVKAKVVPPSPRTAWPGWEEPTPYITIVPQPG
ncbi:MAG: hypothetical protein ACO3PB_07405, partial [Miltoncostaeaceae bacterium]